MGLADCAVGEKLQLHVGHGLAAPVNESLCVSSSPAIEAPWLPPTPTV